MNKSILRLVVFLFLLIGSNITYCQNILNEKRIYVLDVTASMIGKGNKSSMNIFGDIKKQLIDAVKDIETPNTEIMIVPFTNKVFNTIDGNTNNVDSLVHEIEKIEIRSGDTNIADAWNFGVNQIDTTKINYLFLLTDGLHNCGVNKEEFYERLHLWDSISNGRYLFAFYFMLSDDAVEKEIVDVADSTRNMWAIHSLNVNTTFLLTDINQFANVYDDHQVKISFRSNHNFIFSKNISFKVIAPENKYYTISDQQLNFKNRSICFDFVELLPKAEMPLDFDIDLCFDYNKEEHPLLFFVPETIKFHIANKGIRTMTLKTFNTEY